MGYRIKQLREERNMTQTELAQKSGVCRATIWALESGVSKVTTTKTLGKIAEALDVKFDNLFETSRYTV